MVFSVLIANSNSATAHGLALLLAQAGEFQADVVSDHEEDIIDRVETGEPDVLLIGPRRDDLDLDKVIARMGDAHPDIKVGVLTSERSIEDMGEAISAGARAYISLDAEPEDLALQVRALAHGHFVVSNSVPADSLLDLTAASELTIAKADETGVNRDLSGRQREILAVLGSGATNSEIGSRFGISENTVKVHVRAILKKLGARNKQEAVAIASRSSR